jgi:adenylate cyclase
MGTEIERKFLVQADLWSPSDKGIHIRQGYLRADDQCTVRVRIAERQGSLTIKASLRALARHEFEYEIPRGDAETMLNLCGQLVEKTRHRETVDTHVWEIDVFHGDNQGLVIAELEVASEDEAFSQPQWLGNEVSGNPLYYNSNLARLPYCRWKGFPEP